MKEVCRPFGPLCFTLNHFRGLRARQRIEVGKPHWFVAPLPPNRTGGSPASGSPVDRYWRADWHSRARAAVILNNPSSAKSLLGYSRLSAIREPLPRAFRRRRRMLRNRIRTQPSRSAKVVFQLCLKYSYQPRRLRFTVAMLACKLAPWLRRVFPRIESLNFSKLFFPGKPAMLDEAVTKEFKAFIVDMDDFSLGGMQS